MRVTISAGCRPPPTPTRVHEVPLGPRLPAPRAQARGAADRRPRRRSGRTAAPARRPVRPRTRPGRDDDRRVSATAPAAACRSTSRGGAASAGRSRSAASQWLVLAAIGWIALSLVLFLISAQIQQGDLSGKADLGGAGYPLTSPNNVLVLGSDARPKDTKEPGASDQRQPLGLDHAHARRRRRERRLSIPRDTIVDIPGHGRDKINAAYAFGGAALAIQTVEQYIGIQVNHLIEVNFDNFPQLIDAMGGITYKGGCVVSEDQRRLQERRLHAAAAQGKTHINGKQALALARTRHNDCNKREYDLTRARRQQKIMRR